MSCNHHPTTSRTFSSSPPNNNPPSPSPAPGSHHSASSSGNLTPVGSLCKWNLSFYIFILYILLSLFVMGVFPSAQCPEGCDTGQNVAPFESGTLFPRVDLIHLHPSPTLGHLHCPGVQISLPGPAFPSSGCVPTSGIAESSHTCF